MAEADAEDRPLADQVADGVDDVVESRGVAGAVGEEDDVGLLGQHLLGRVGAGQQGQPAAVLAQLADDVELDPGVDPDHVRAVAFEADRLRRGDGAGEVGAVHRGLGLDAFARLAPRPDRPGRCRRASRRWSRMWRTSARVSTPLIPGTPQSLEPVEPAALGAGDVLAVLGVAHDDAAGVDAVGLHRLGRDAVVADQRVGEDDDLARVGGVGDRLLVAGHRGVEDDLAGDRLGVARRARRRSGSRPRAGS